MVMHVLTLGQQFSFYQLDELNGKQCVYQSLKNTRIHLKKNHLTLLSSEIYMIPQLVCAYGDLCGTRYEPESIECFPILEEGYFNERIDTWKCTVTLLDEIDIQSFFVTDVLCGTTQIGQDIYLCEGTCSLEYELSGGNKIELLQQPVILNANTIDCSLLLLTCTRLAFVMCVFFLLYFFKKYKRNGA